MSNDNQAYKWLTEWLDKGGNWCSISIAGASYLALYDHSSQSSIYIGFRDDIRQILEDAEAGRKMREGVSE
jgi:hypothetical protein